MYLNIRKAFENFMLFIVKPITSILRELLKETFNNMHVKNKYSHAFRTYLFNIKATGLQEYKLCSKILINEICVKSFKLLIF